MRAAANICWAKAPLKIARVTLTIKLDGNWSSFQLANSAPPLSVTGSAIAPSARMHSQFEGIRPLLNAKIQTPPLPHSRKETKVCLLFPSEKILSPQRVCCNQLGAMLVQHARAAEQARADTCPRKINVTSKSPVGDISVVTLIRTDTTLDHSQKAEKVCVIPGFNPIIIQAPNCARKTQNQ